jgi:hypothetical protein
MKNAAQTIASAFHLFGSGMRLLLPHGKGRGTRVFD